MRSGRQEEQTQMNNAVTLASKEETRVITSLIKFLTSRGYELTLSGPHDEDAPRSTNTLGAEAVEYVIARNNMGLESVIVLIYGNGLHVVSDYTINPKDPAFDQHMIDWMNQAE